MSAMPQRVNVMRTITYDVSKIVEQIQADRGSEVIYDKSGARPLASPAPITIEEVLERIEEYVKDDFSCGWGHEFDDLGELTFQDEDGNEL